jgi:hypothetical protein
MRKPLVSGAALVALAMLISLGGSRAHERPAVQEQKSPSKAVLPIFEVDSRFPTMPDRMLLGGVGGATADSHGNVWVFHRPHTLEEGNATENGYVPGPPVMEFSEDGKYIQGWGGPTHDDRYQWFNRGGLFSAFAECASCSKEHRTNGDGRPGSGEHGITVDYKDNVWLTGNGAGDGQILKFTRDGTFLLQIGKGGVAVDSNNTEHLSRPAAVVVYPRTNEVFVADGYGNRRVVVFDADSGKFKRMWGAFGNKPIDEDNCEIIAPKTFEAGQGPDRFNVAHGIRVSKDGMVYLADRENRRVQSFTVDGKFVKQLRKTDTPFARNVAFSADPEQQFLYVGDGKTIAIVDRKSLEIVGSIAAPGMIGGGHEIATDSKGNLYIAGTGAGIQKLTFKRMASTQ